MPLVAPARRLRPSFAVPAPTPTPTRPPPTSSRSGSWPDGCEVCLSTLELAGSRLAALGPEALLERLDSAPQLLGRAGGTGPEHHRSLDAAIAWSHDLLPGPAPQVLAACSVFASPFRLEDAEDVCEAAGVARDDLAPALAEPSSVLARRPTDPPRRRPLPAVRARAGVRPAPIGGGRNRRSRTAAAAQHFAHMMAHAAEHGGGGRLGRSRRALDEALPDLRAALDWLEEQPDVDLHRDALAMLFIYWFDSGRIAEGRRRTRAAADRHGGSPALHADVLTASAFLAWWAGDYDTVRRDLDRARPLARDSGRREVLLGGRGGAGVGRR
ncbi:MAG: hypothetical protein U5R31_11640 [Acidimicrobiia bacterium]|nr:hypothetical protein [Acidimicrobiia bacterium]